MPEEFYNPEVYNPAIQSLLATAKDDWGDPKINREKLVPYGIGLLDRATYGIDVHNGEFVLVQGREKRRKSTFISNAVANYFDRDNLPLVKPQTNIDILESSVPVKKYRDQLISNVASRYLMADGHLPSPAFCPQCGSSPCKELTLSPKFLRYNSRTRTQIEAIDYAISAMEEWPLFLHGAHYNMGDTRSLQRAIKRFEWFIEEFGVRIFIVDHVQQYMWIDDPTDYEKQIRAVGVLSDVVARYGVAMIVVSQVSLGSWRASKRGEVLTAAGGAKGAQESATVLSMDYKGNSGEMIIKIEEAREAADLTLIQPMDDISGAFYGQAVYAGMSNATRAKETTENDFTLD